MDWSMIYLFGFIILALVFVVGIVFLMRKYNVKPEEITNGIDITKTIASVIKITTKELNFASDDTINQIADLVIDSLEYVKTLANVNTKEEKVEAGIKYVEDLCNSFEIEMDEDRYFVVSILVQLGVNLLESLNGK
ncbi:MAG: hypothetical protein PHD20_05410 [Clostridia bacterium]|nr:hypothetical protein [Clostridia bacterium]MDD4779028.1 hypothetical protein [Tissierellia bacterium]